jgi:hypothetical protein
MQTWCLYATLAIASNLCGMLIKLGMIYTLSSAAQQSCHTWGHTLWALLLMELDKHNRPSCLIVNVDLLANCVLRSLSLPIDTTVHQHVALDAETIPMPTLLRMPAVGPHSWAHPSELESVAALLLCVPLALLVTVALAAAPPQPGFVPVQACPHYHPA